MSQKDITLNGLAAYKLLNEVINEEEETEQGEAAFFHLMSLIKETPHEGFGVVLGMSNIISLLLVRLENEVNMTSDEILRDVAKDVMMKF